MKDSLARNMLEHAATLVAGGREKTHGDKVENHRNIAALWNAYLGDRLGEGCRLTPADVARMMVLLKVARTKTGDFNPDDYIDMAGYAAVAFEIEGRPSQAGAPEPPPAVPQAER